MAVFPPAAPLRILDGEPLSQSNGIRRRNFLPPLVGFSVPFNFMSVPSSTLLFSNFVLLNVSRLFANIILILMWVFFIPIVYSLIL